MHQVFSWFVCWVLRLDFMPVVCSGILRRCRRRRFLCGLSSGVRGSRRQQCLLRVQWWNVRLVDLQQLHKLCRRNLLC